MIKGYRSLVVAGVGVVFNVAPIIGIELPADLQAEVVSAILFLIAFVLRFDTNTKVGESK